MGAPLYRSEVVRRLGLAVVALVAIACTPNAPSSSPSAGSIASTVPTASAGGATSGTTGSPAAATWRRIADIPSARSEVAAVAFRGAVYVIGGFGSGNRVERYEVGADRWSRIADLPVSVDHPMAAAIDDGAGAGIYLIGGNAGGPLARAFVLSPGATSWREIARMPGPRSQGAAAAISGQIFVFGGFDGSRLVAPTYAYDVARDTWREVAAMPTPRDHLAGFAWRGQACALGGRRLSLTTNLAAFECFDPVRNAWDKLPDAPTPRGGVGATAVERGVVFVGGEQPSSTYREVELFDAATQRWSRLPDLPTPRHGIGVVAVGQTVFVMTGGPTPGGSQIAVCEALTIGN
jgi:N-acetylneuraminic acid mutarotase